jgi:hypothetical protein
MVQGSYAGTVSDGVFCPWLTREVLMFEEEEEEEE